jgi:hypothetical protein
MKEKPKLLDASDLLIESRLSGTSKRPDLVVRQIAAPSNYDVADYTARRRDAPDFLYFFFFSGLGAK